MTLTLEERFDKAMKRGERLFPVRTQTIASRLRYNRFFHEWAAASENDQPRRVALHFLQAKDLIK